MSSRRHFSSPGINIRSTSLLKDGDDDGEKEDNVIKIKRDLSEIYKRPRFVVSSPSSTPSSSISSGNGSVPLLSSLPSPISSRNGSEQSSQWSEYSYGIDPEIIEDIGRMNFRDVTSADYSHFVSSGSPRQNLRGRTPVRQNGSESNHRRLPREMFGSGQTLSPSYYSPPIVGELPKPRFIPTIALAERRLGNYRLGGRPVIPQPIAKQAPRLRSAAQQLRQASIGGSDVTMSSTYLSSPVVGEQLLPQFRQESVVGREGQQYGFYRIIREISHGAYGTVYEVEVTQDFNNNKFQFEKGKRLAMKEERRPDEIAQIPEIDILNRVNHPNVVNAYDTFERTDDEGNCVGINLVLPLADYNLSDLLDEFELEPRTKLDLIHQLLCGLYYLHSNYIIHEDIKPQNILIFKDSNDRYIAKISDFGLSNIYIPGSYALGPSQTLFWRPPEILGYEIEASFPGHEGPRNAPHGFEGDIWAMGMVIFEIIVGVPPIRFDEIPHLNSREFKLEMLVKIDQFLKDNSWKRHPVFSGILKDAPALISAMLGEDQFIRITAEQALNYPIFDGYACVSEQIEVIPWNMRSNMTPDDRKRIIVWMDDYSNRMDFSFVLLFLSIDIFDRFIAALYRENPISSLNTGLYQLYASVAMYLASELLKEEAFYPIEEFLAASGNIYTMTQFINTQCKMLKMLDWVVFRPSLYLLYPDLIPENLLLCHLQYREPSLQKCEPFIS